MRLQRGDHSEYWAEVTSVLLDEGFVLSGQRRGSIIVVQDISDRKQANEALARYAAELERSNQELEQFAYVASHDLQEPLRMVASYVQLLAKDYAGKLDEDADEYIGFAVDGAKRMQRLIDDLLAFSRVGTRGQQFQPVDCSQLLQDVLQGLKLAIEESGAAVTYGELPTVMADRGQMYQLLQNLIANALKFRADAPPRIHVSADLACGWEHDGGPVSSPGSADNSDTSQLGLCRRRQRHRHRSPVRRTHLRHLSTAAQPRPVLGHRHRPGHLQEDRRTPRRPYLGGIHARPRRHLLLSAAPNDWAAGPLL